MEIALRIASAISFIGLPTALSAQQLPCSQIQATAAMSRAKSSGQLAAGRQIAGHSYRSELVFAARSFEIRTAQSAARRLLDLIPKQAAQQQELMTLGDSLCDGESLADMKSLAALGERIPRDLAKAVLLHPAEMPSYLSYAEVAVEDPHSDYAVQMQSVCRSKHSEFLKATRAMSAEKEDWFVKRVFNPYKCQALALPESY